MIGCCVVCGVNFETTEEDANDPGPDLRGPRCPTCYRIAAFNRTYDDNARRRRQYEDDEQ